jgi:hypothetical protein
MRAGELRYAGELRPLCCHRPLDMTCVQVINESSRSIVRRAELLGEAAAATPRRGGEEEEGRPATADDRIGRGWLAAALKSIRANIRDVWEDPSGLNIGAVFSHYDRDRDGVLSYQEWVRAVRRDGISYAR